MVMNGLVLFIIAKQFFWLAWAELDKYTRLYGLLIIRNQKLGTGKWLDSGDLVP